VKLLFRFLIVVAAWSLGQAQAQERHIGKGYLNLLA
tara:strand:+ start:659 stop:766 length:108 start_codon:yes stop_codon:yes gene_type:complete